MKIALLSSMSFKKKIVANKKNLEKLNYTVGTPYETAKMSNSKKDHDRLKKEQDLIRANYNYVKTHDAVLVLNYSKSEIKNYIGGNSLIEMSFAYVMNKQIYLLNNIPDMKYSAEIEAMNPIILNGDLEKIK